MHIFAGDLGCDMKEDSQTHKCFSMFKDKYVLYMPDLKETKEEEYFSTKTTEVSCLSSDASKFDVKKRFMNH